MKERSDQSDELLPVHSPVRRLFAERYLLITLLSFALSVTLTRLFLNLTGFPQLGRGELHIAHMLWGGLLLFAASLLPLIFANRWFLDISAFLSGIGVGLFIDEVGKFITSHNDYFYPAAAPIIYSFFLLTLFIYSLLRRGKKPDQRRNIYLALERLEDVIDHDLSEREKNEIITLLKEIPGEPQNPELSSLAKSLVRYLRSQKIRLVAEKPSWWQKLEHRWQSFETQTFNRTRHRFYLVVGLFLWACWAIAHSLLSWQLSLYQVPLPGLVAELINNRLPLSASGFGAAELQVILEVASGVLLFFSLVLFLFRQEKKGSATGCDCPRVFNQCCESLRFLLRTVFLNFLRFYSIYPAADFIAVSGALYQESAFIVNFGYLCWQGIRLSASGQK